MAKVKSFVVRGDFCCGFDRSFSSYTAGARALVVLEPGDDYEEEFRKAQAKVAEMAADEAWAFKAEHDKVRTNVTKGSK